MTASLMTLRVALIVLIIVAIFIIIEASWSLNVINSTTGDNCNCSGVTSSQLSGLRAFEIIMLLLGIGVIIYAVILFLSPVSDSRRAVGAKARERFNRKTT